MYCYRVTLRSRWREVGIHPDRYHSDILTEAGFVELEKISTGVSVGFFTSRWHFHGTEEDVLLFKLKYSPEMVEKVYEVPS